jgi:2-C-methyl-D-erythritol 4-phosphate cytidylyltransferase
LTTKPSRRESCSASTKEKLQGHAPHANLRTLATEHLTAIIAAAGSSNRMGFDKMFADLGDRPVIVHTIAAFENFQAVDDIIVVANPERVTDVTAAIEQAGFIKVTNVVKGGETRRDSVASALDHVSENCDFVSVHDGARPWITPAQIERVLNCAAKHGAAASAHPVTDTLKRADEEGQVESSIEREGMWAMETPQIFRAGLLKEAFAKVLAENLQVSDEVSAVQHLGQPVRLVQNSTLNPKVTFPADLKLPPPTR